jgi:hypothetical protein
MSDVSDISGPSDPASSDAVTAVAANIAVVEGFWAALGRRDFAAVGALMAPEGHYVDVPVIGVDDGAFGPAETEARLRLGLEPLRPTSSTTGSWWPAATT